MIFAYIDPGSGSMLLQVLLAGVLSAPFVFRRAIGNGWARLRGRPAATDTATVVEPVESVDTPDTERGEDRQ